MKITIDTDRDEDKIFRILLRVKSSLAKKPIAAAMIKVMGITSKLEIINLKVVMAASRLRSHDELEITIRWGIFSDDKPPYKKITAHVKRTADKKSDILFQFGIPNEEGPTEELTIAYYIFYGIVKALEFQKSFVDIDKRLISEQIAELENEANKQFTVVEERQSALDEINNKK